MLCKTIVSLPSELTEKVSIAFKVQALSTILKEVGKTDKHLIRTTQVRDSTGECELSHYIGKVEDQPEDVSVKFEENKWYNVQGSGIKLSQYQGKMQLGIGFYTKIEEIKLIDEEVKQELAQHKKLQGYAKILERLMSKSHVDRKSRRIGKKIGKKIKAYFETVSGSQSEDES